MNTKHLSRANSGSLFLGIDIGSVSLSHVLIDADDHIVDQEYVFHRGNPFHLLKQKLGDLDLTRVPQVGFNHNAGDFFRAGLSVNQQVSLIEGVRFQERKVGSFFVIGGEMFGLILFDKNDFYQKFISNSSCAAGTGAFLDQQAERLGLADSAELSRLADAFEGDPPKIATRCAVFAKTDLIHCQQQGSSVEAIAAGLCKGLAHNIADTLVKGTVLPRPVIAVGGVSRNPKVMHYLEEIIGCPIAIPRHSVLTGALGCALVARSRSQPNGLPPGFSAETLLKNDTPERQYFFAPLSSELSSYPDFTSHCHYESREVEVDIYDLPPNGSTVSVYLGIDIGSTSTKAVVMDAGSEKQHMLFGLYTRTKGQPIKATQALFRVIDDIERAHQVRFDFSGVGTTGSGRKFIEKVIRADVAIDEITAHARAAAALHPDVDTIIEIGGQDSKFTILRNGRVTFSLMNYVCAAGTGSFIEEQARRLGVSLNDYAAKASETASPLTSDRCTVFMERDLNHYLSQGYGTDELLAAALHSVRDNYLSKVAHVSKIGDVICFQGATAKNRALVAAFEQKLQKPIFVSKYCHLTGALGICLLMKEKGFEKTRFRGLDFCNESPDVSEEICELCKNHCKLKRVEIGNEHIMWGFLCGRDENSLTRKPISQSGFDLLGSRTRVFKAHQHQGTDPGRGTEPGLAALPRTRSDFDISLEKFKENVALNLMDVRHKIFTVTRDELHGVPAKIKVRIGIPDALYLQSHLPFWRLFFRKLGYTVVKAPPHPRLQQKGKEISGAEFCAPISYWHGQVADLSQRADYIFLPHMFAVSEATSPKFYCYYSSYAVPLVQNIQSLNLSQRCISPVLDLSKPAIDNVQKIYESLPQALKLSHSPSAIHEAYAGAWRWFTNCKKELREIFHEHTKQQDDVSVVLLGRPYTALDPVMNKDIPRKFSALGVKTFYQDMLPTNDFETDDRVREFLEWNHWKFGEDILRAAAYVAQKPAVYPVFLTAFKCSPDSFLLTYFREMMDARGKPYLILQIDEHGSDVGYGTRVESAVEAFRNHLHAEESKRAKKTGPSVLTEPCHFGTILVPNLDGLSCSLICAALEKAGYRSRLIEETPTTVRSSLRLNDGQCMPVSTIVQGAIETIERHGLDPNDTAIFLSVVTRLACNLPQYPLMAKKLLEQRGGDFEKVQVIGTSFEMLEFSYEAIYDVYCAHLFGGLLRRLGCTRRPYELNPGQTDALIDTSRESLYHCFANGESKEAVFKKIVADFAAVPVNETLGTRPKVAVIGDLYVRDNDVFNQQLIRELEGYGAEVITTPFSQVLRMLAVRHNYRLRQEGRYLALMRSRVLIEVFEKLEKSFFNLANGLLCEAFPTFDESIFDDLKKYQLSTRHAGETAQNVMKIFSMLRHYPDLSLFIHVNPIFCCPGLVSESMFKAIEKDIGIPIVSVTYDGTGAKRNEVLAPYVHYVLESAAQRTEQTAAHPLV